mmetsp:Transcript_15231/g.47534  ORF Transcript_15231/g.47534 Transcript_15231/m.47534 type:complete len:209 (+) Transcript_15231:1131-1757(+)
MVAGLPERLATKSAPTAAARSAFVAPATLTQPHAWYVPSRTPGAVSSTSTRTRPGDTPAHPAAATLTSSALGGPPPRSPCRTSTKSGKRAGGVAETPALISCAPSDDEPKRRAGRAASSVRFARQASDDESARTVASGRVASFSGSPKTCRCVAPADSKVYGSPFCPCTSTTSTPRPPAMPVTVAISNDRWNSEYVCRAAADDQAQSQ